MKTLLRCPNGLYETLIQHLLPRNSTREEAAFLFVTTNLTEAHAYFDVIDSVTLSPADFDVQMDDYLELAHETRARLIKQAHDLGASLVEIHSHPGPYEAAFSLSDRRGLQETVPHMWWRLSKRPYLAIVVARSGFDALVWLDNPQIPQKLDGILAADRLLKPTNYSLGEWT